MLLGHTRCSPSGLFRLMQRLSRDFKMGDYDLFHCNCNSFVSELCVELLGVAIPNYVDRLAAWGRESTSIRQLGRQLMIGSGRGGAAADGRAAARAAERAAAKSQQSDAGEGGDTVAAAERGSRRRASRSAGAVGMVGADDKAAVERAASVRLVDDDSTEALQARLRTLQEALTQAKSGLGEATSSLQRHASDNMEDVDAVRAQLHAIPVSSGRDLYGREIDLK